MQLQGQGVRVDRVSLRSRTLVELLQLNLAKAQSNDHSMRIQSYIALIVTYTHKLTLMSNCYVVDLKRLYYTAGVENKQTVFLFNDVQVVEESFLEDINNILSSGEVPNLYKPDEFEEVCILTRSVHELVHMYAVSVCVCMYRYMYMCVCIGVCTCIYLYL